MGIVDGTRSALKLVLICASLVTLAAVAAGTAKREGEKTMARTKILPMDASAPRKKETATFALG